VLENPEEKLAAGISDFGHHTLQPGSGEVLGSFGLDSATWGGKVNRRAIVLPIKRLKRLDIGGSRSTSTAVLHIL
jgi:hypothetical protein